MFWERLQSVVAADPSAPLVTWRGELGRIELSRRTFGAAVVKAANLLGEELGVEPGTAVAVDLGAHWQSCVWHAAVLVCGGTVVDADPQVAVIAPEAGSPAAAGKTVVVGLDPFGMPPREVAAGSINGCAEVRAMPDALMIAPADGVAAGRFSGASLDFATLDYANLGEAAAGAPPGPVALVGEGGAHERLLWHAVVPCLTGIAIVLGSDVGEQARVQEHVASVVALVG